MIHTFKASHCGQTFTGAEGAKALELHMKAEHGLVMRRPGGNTHDECRNSAHYLSARIGTAPGWRNGEIEKPHPWKAPRPTPGGLGKVLADAQAGKYRVVYPTGMVAGRRQWIDAGHVEQAS